MKQTGLINHVTNDVGIDNDMSEVKYTPAVYVPLVNNYYGVPDNGSFNYIAP